MVRTTVGEALRAPAAEFVRVAEALLLQQSESFSAATWRGTFPLMTSDYVYVTLASPLERALEERAPGLNLVMTHVADDSDEWLRHNDGLAIGPLAVSNSDVKEEPLFRDHMVLAVRVGHPLSRRRITLKHYCELSHVLVAPRGRPGSMVNTMLDQTGLVRRVARVVPTHTLAAHIIAASDCVSTLPARFVEAVGDRFGLVGRPLPFDLPGIELRVSWHRRHDASPVHNFMRRLLREAASGS
jgi:DNA-binding transcriptional LysR family regulator